MPALPGYNGLRNIIAIVFSVALALTTDSTKNPTTVPNTVSKALASTLLAFIVLAATTLLPSAVSAAAPAGPVPEVLIAEVRFVVDGDSLYLAGVKQQIRLWGVDAPERNKPGFNAARNALKQLVAKQNIHCRQQDVDKYGRIVARCRLAELDESVDFSVDRQRDINAQMIRGGTAREYCYFSKGFYGACLKR